jgi:hypothetical protein
MVDCVTLGNLMSNGRFGLGGIFKVNPHHALAQTFKSGALECVACARELLNLNSTPQYILTFHALELALKSYLASKGMPALTLKKKYSHRLSKMLVEARKHGLTVEIEDIDELLVWVDELHGNGSVKYGLEPFQMLPSCSDLLFVADQILQSVAD